MSQSSAKPPLLRNEAPLTSVLRELVPGFASTPGALGRNLTGEPSSIVAHPPPRGVPAVGDDEEVWPQPDKGFPFIWPRNTRVSSPPVSRPHGSTHTPPA